MKNKFKDMASRLFSLIILICSTLTIFHAEESYAAEEVSSVLIKKVSQSYTKKFCNSIGFGLSKESAMKFSLKENKTQFGSAALARSARSKCSASVF